MPRIGARLLLDDVGVGQVNDDAYLALDAHPNLSVRLFNPIASRDSRTMGVLGDARRLNHRMHDMDIVQIALIQGYSNASAFTRAFRRWSATTPAKWRTLEKVSG